ncbi:Mur ligase family protein [Lactiplantibacillus carotarum]|uniref:Mur ligase family protein n=1 Tax=Lactiplantibacillus carotarum TaxID=2993456 RepID=UPI00298F2FA0|nr:Mur ligase family protein [Lactiplantibacillus carotarum]
MIDCFGHKRSQFNYGSSKVNGAFVYLDSKRRAELHAGQYPDDFDLVAWLRDHMDRVKLLVTEQPIQGLPENFPQFIVPNAWAFYLEVATYTRRLYDGNVISVTGSVGKSTTRLMIVRILQQLKRRVVTNDGNENVRTVVVPLLTKTLRNPDDLVAELSINALNNRDPKGGPVSRIYQSDAAVITQIGGAHLADIQNVKDPLMFLAERKARIFEGMKSSGRAIINYDMVPRVYKYVEQRARLKTDHIYTFSYSNQHADAFVRDCIDYREYSVVTIQVLDKTYDVKLTMPGVGVIMDLLAACLTVQSLGITLPDLTNIFVDFQALNSELKFYDLPTATGVSKLVDDTHGSTIHSVKNILSVFKARGKFYRGKKVLIMETGEDLGNQVATYNLQLKGQILDSGIDVLYSYRDPAIKTLSDSLNTSMETHFFKSLDAIQAAIDRLPEDSLIMVKSSDGRKYGSDLWTLPEKMLTREGKSEK